MTDFITLASHCVVGVGKDSGMMVLRWGIASVGIFFTRRGSPYMGKIFQVRDMDRWATLNQNRKDEESRHVALIIIFVKSFKKTSLTCRARNVGKIG